MTNISETARRAALELYEQRGGQKIVDVTAGYDEGGSEILLLGQRVGGDEFCATWVPVSALEGREPQEFADEVQTALIAIEIEGRLLGNAESAAEQALRRSLAALREQREQSITSRLRRQRCTPEQVHDALAEFRAIHERIAADAIAQLRSAGSVDA